MGLELGPGLGLGLGLGLELGLRLGLGLGLGPTGYTTYTGELQAAVSFLRVRRRVALLLLLQSGAGYLGILSYLETVRRFGPKVTTIVTSSRKLFTIALSSVIFGHPLNGYHVAGVSAVFLGVLLNANANLACRLALTLARTRTRARAPSPTLTLTPTPTSPAAARSCSPRSLPPPSSWRRNCCHPRLWRRPSRRRRSRRGPRGSRPCSRGYRRYAP